MGAAVGTEEGGGKPRNVELNIIPFIDLLSCLTAFLLVTAVWVNISQLDTQVAGKARDQVVRDDDEPKLSVLVEPDQIWIGVSRVEEYETIPNTAGGHDFEKLAARLREHKTSALFADKSNVQVAAQSTAAAPVSYQALVFAMDAARKAGFADVQISDPHGLYAQPRI